MAAKEHREHRADENQGKGGEINHEPCEKRKPFRRGMIGQTFTWEKAGRRRVGSGKRREKRWQRARVSRLFAPFPGISHLFPLKFFMKNQNSRILARGMIGGGIGEDL